MCKCGHLGTWFIGGLDSVRFMVGLDDLKDLFQRRWFYDSRPIEVFFVVTVGIDSCFLSNKGWHFEEVTSLTACKVHWFETFHWLHECQTRLSVVHVHFAAWESSRMQIYQHQRFKMICLQIYKLELSFSCVIWQH